ncbi:hypothetical protein U5B43_07165 [Campylobacter sp. 9BO]|uniref:hypothetical protein n=1 Tax=Campylobacter sp. 9BO TaxID=3424759 RepID=UPI003D324F05
MNYGHSLDIGEITPNIFKKLSPLKKTYNFLVLYNSCVNESMQIPLSFSKFGSIKSAFLTRLNQLLGVNLLKNTKPTTLCLASNALIDCYKSKNFTNINKIVSNPKHPAAKFIQMLYKNGEFELIFDADFMFSQFVYGKITRKHFDKNLYFQDGIITIENNGKKYLSVLPSFKEFSPENSQKLAPEISRAASFLQSSECKSLYVVLPRHSEFCRHIEVRHSQCKKCIKLVPYTINNII